MAGRSIVAGAIVVGIAGGALTSLLAWSRFIPDPLVFHVISLAAIATIYMGFGLADGRLLIAILELSVATAFVVLALLGLWLAPAFVAAGLMLHGVWDLLHRPHGVTTKLPSWYPPFCAAFDFVFAGVFFILARGLAGRVP